MFILFEDEHTSTIGHGETATACIERCTSIFQGLGMGERSAISEASYCQGVYGCLGTSSDDGVGHAALDGVVGLTHRVGTRGTSRDYGQAGSLCIVSDGDVARCYIGNHGGDEEW